MPAERTTPFIGIMIARRSNERSPHPVASPNSPVVKANICSSLGSIRTNRIFVKRYAHMPCFNEMTVLRRIGRVARGLISSPTPGNNPPADCKIAESADNMAVRAIFFAASQDFVILCRIRRFRDNDLVKYMSTPHFLDIENKCFILL